MLLFQLFILFYSPKMCDEPLFMKDEALCFVFFCIPENHAL